MNLPFYASAVTNFTASIAPPSCSRWRGRGLRRHRFRSSCAICDADRLPFADASFDTVVVTWSLCSIANARDALREMRRVLKPGGTLIFVEHGLSPDAGVRKWQNRLTPFWRPFTGGCHLNRKMDDLVRDAGFTITDLRAEYLPGPRALAFMYEGRAVRD